MLGDTDRTPLALHVLDLHALLSDAGLEVRTIALAPGASGGLDQAVPVLGPTSRSAATRLQLGREQRWADVVVCVGPASAAVQRRSPGHRRVASVVLCTSGPVGRRECRALAAADMVLHDGCEPPVPGAVEVFTATEDGDGVLASDELAATWGGLLAAAADAAGSRSGS